jgi:hypothetical protein
MLRRLLPLLAVFTLAVPTFADEKKQENASKPAAKITIDTSDAPEMKDFAERAQKVADEWYPIIISKLPSAGFKPATEVTIVFKKDYKGVAAASGNKIVCSPKWFTDHPDDVGAIVHELTHVVQAYRRGDRPGWLVEGIADYIRFFQYEPVKARPHPDPKKAKYSDSYRTTAHFLDWAQQKYDKDLVVKLNTACREGKYSEDLWKQATGKTLEELGDAWKESLKPGK